MLLYSFSPAIPAILNGYNVKLTLRIITVISVVKFIACACIAALGIYQIAVGGKIVMLLCIVNYLCLSECLASTGGQ